MTPKPAYDQLKALIKGKWWTQAEAQTASDGETRFRGFFGQYKLTASSADRQLAGGFTFDKSSTEPIEVRLA